MGGQESPPSIDGTVVERAPVPVVVYDADGHIVYVNEAAVELAGGDDPDQLEGEPVEGFVADEDVAGVAERMHRVIEEREQVGRRELTLRGVDGQTVHAEAAGGPVTYDGEPAGQAVLHEVTGLKRRERELRRERDRFATLFENLPSPVVHGEVYDNGPVVRKVNPAFEEMFGYDAEAVVGENLDDLTVPEDRREQTRALNQRILEEGRYRTEVVRETADGRREFVLDVVLDDDVDPLEGYAIYTDITEQKERQAELERQNERLDEFAGIVSHDLRSPLSVAKGNLAIYRDDGDDDRLDRVDDALDRMETLLEELLALAREGETVDETQPVELRSSARRAWQGVETRNATLSADGAPTVQADAVRLEELLENLFRNAVEHGSTSSQQGAGDAVEHGGADVAVTVDHLDAPDATGFYVADDGPGIPDDEREVVFEPGHTSAEDGTGFGLAIVREVAEAHGWEVRAAESDAGGARFEFADVELAERED